MMEVMGLFLWAGCAGSSVCSPVGEVKRTADESPYTTALARALRRDVMARGLTKDFQVIICLLLLLGWAP
jgi:hypothetical protein